MEYSWQFVGVLNYCQEKGLYLVHKADSSGHIKDAEGNPVLNGAQKIQGKYCATNC